MSLARNPVLASILAGLPGPPTIRVAMYEAGARSIAFWFSVAKILTPRPMQVFLWESYGGNDAVSAWVERTTTPGEVRALGLHVFEVRRGNVGAVEPARAMTTEEARRHDQRVAEDASTQLTFTDYGGVPVYSEPAVPRLEDPCRVFDARTLIDLPPSDWPSTGTIIDCFRNLEHRYDTPPNGDRVWAGHSWRILKEERREEQHANRVLANEELAAALARRKQRRQKEQGAKALRVLERAARDVARRVTRVRSTLQAAHRRAGFIARRWHRRFRSMA